MLCGGRVSRRGGRRFVGRDGRSAVLDERVAVRLLAALVWLRHTRLVIDVVPGRGSGFSLEAPEGARFLTRSRVFSADEERELEATGEPVSEAAQQLALD